MLAKYDGVSTERFVQRDNGDLFSFASVEYLFEEILSSVNQLRSGGLERLPTSIAKRALAALRALDPSLHGIINFSASQLAAQQENPIPAHQELVETLRATATKFFDDIPPVLAYMVGNTSTDVLGRAADDARTVIEQMDQLARNMAERQRELDEIVSASRQAAAKVGVSAHAAHFAEEASTHAAEARSWLRATALVALVTLVAGMTNYYVVAQSRTAVDNGHVAQLIVAKVILLSLLVSATIWCGKNYRASRHNNVVNRHRQNALSSFQAFAESATDEQTKNAVLLQATQSIFSPQASGYVGGEGDASGSPQVIEFVRSITGTEK